jgi:nucleoside-specific outer membrane channel protein Tsx
MDFTNYNGSSISDGFYGEVSPRISFNKITDHQLEFGIVKDVLLASTFEFGKGDVGTFLVGPGFDLDLPCFDYFKLNIYKRFPDGGRDGDTIQISPVWSMTFPSGQSDIIFDGYMDWVIDNDGSYHSNLLFNPQLKYDLGKLMGYGSRRFLVGIEYSYWKNKYGIKDSKVLNTDQSVVSLLLQYHF